MDHTRIAMQIFRELLDKGQLDRETNNELFLNYMNQEVQEVLDMVQEEVDCHILRLNNTIYLIPEYDNLFLGYRNKDMREWLGGANPKQSDVFLAYYIVIFILHLFYGGKNKDPKQREFLRVTTIIEELDSRMRKALEDEENTAVLEEKYSMNFKKTAENWDSRKAYEERRQGTKHGFTMRVLRLLVQERLLRISDDEKEIRATKKLDDLMLYHYLNDSRVQEIQNIFMGGEE